MTKLSTCPRQLEQQQQKTGYLYTIYMATILTRHTRIVNQNDVYIQIMNNIHTMNIWNKMLGKKQ